MRSAFQRNLLPGSGMTALVCLASAMCLAPASIAQSSEGEQGPPSLGEIARRYREQRPPAPIAKKVWTNDNLPKNPFAISVVGAPPPPPSMSGPGENAAATPAKPKTAEELKAALTDTQNKLDTAEKELDLLRRDYVLQQQGYYSNPMASQDPQIQAALADARAKIDAKQQEVDQLKEQVADLQAKVEDASKNPPSTPPTPPGGSGQQ